MAHQTTCDLCTALLTKSASQSFHPRIVMICPPQLTAAPGKYDDIDLDLDVCKNCLRRVIGVVRDCFGPTGSPELVEKTAVFLRETAGDPPADAISPPKNANSPPKNEF